MVTAGARSGARSRPSPAPHQRSSRGPGGTSCTRCSKSYSPAATPTIWQPKTTGGAARAGPGRPARPHPPQHHRPSPGSVPNAQAVAWPRCRTDPGRCIMSRSGAFYFVKVMEMAAAGTTAADSPGAPARRAAGHRARAARPERRLFPLVRRALAAVGRVRGPAGVGPRRRSGQGAGAVPGPGRDVVLAGDQQIVADAAARLGGAGDDRAGGRRDGLAPVRAAGPELAGARSRLGIGRW